MGESSSTSTFMVICPYPFIYWCERGDLNPHPVSRAGS
jgi:hypothetical protein